MSQFALETLSLFIPLIEHPTTMDLKQTQAAMSNNTLTNPILLAEIAVGLLHVSDPAKRTRLLQLLLNEDVTALLNAKAEIEALAYEHPEWEDGDELAPYFDKRVRYCCEDASKFSNLNRLCNAFHRTYPGSDPYIRYAITSAITRLHVLQNQ